MDASTVEVTLLLNGIGAGDKAQSAEKLLPLVYAELRKLAHGYLQNERPDHTLQATALVHEAYIRLVDWHTVSWQNRAHFFAVAAQVMRRILVDHAREKRARKRDFGQRLALDDTVSFSAPNGLDLILLDECLEKLKSLDAAQAAVVEMRFFAGMTIEETAAALGISPATVKREWTAARAWLYRRMKDEG